MWHSLRRQVIPFLAGAVFMLFVVAFQQERSKTVAVVNGEAIPRSLFLSRAVRVCGDDVLSMLTDEKLIEQAMHSQNISVSPKEIKEKVKAFRYSFPDDKKYNEWVQKHQLTTQDLQDQAKLDIGLEKLVGATLDENELRKYYEHTKGQYRTKDGKVMSFDEAKPQVAQIFVQEKKKNFLEKLRENVRLEKFPPQIPLIGNN